MHRWVLLYEMAVYEVDDAKRLDLITLAERAIQQRQQALDRSKADHIKEEVSLNEASYILSASRNAAEFNRGQKQARRSNWIGRRRVRTYRTIAK